jgi:hypothetical protein
MLPEQNKGIGDQQVADAAPYVRALVVQRLEMLWRACEPHIDGTGGKPDPRYLETGVRVIDRLSRLYRLDAPEKSDLTAVTGSDVSLRAKVLKQIEDLESRVKPMGS